MTEQQFKFLMLNLQVMLFLLAFIAGLLFWRL